MKKWDIVWVLLARHHENPYSNSFHTNSFFPSGSRMQAASRLVAFPFQSAPRVSKPGSWPTTHHHQHACSHTASNHVCAHSPHLMCLPTRGGGQPEDRHTLPCAWCPVKSKRSGGRSFEPRAWRWPGPAGWAKLHGSYFGGLSSTAQYKKHGLK